MSDAAKEASHSIFPQVCGCLSCCGDYDVPTDGVVATGGDVEAQKLDLGFLGASQDGIGPELIRVHHTHVSHELLGAKELGHLPEGAG